MFALVAMALGFGGPLLPAEGEASVVLGRALTNAHVPALACPEASCWESAYAWDLEASRTLAGPDVRGRVRAVISAHGAANSKYVRSIELFVIRPLASDEVRITTGATHVVVAVATRTREGKYCLPTDPRSLGLNVDSRQNDYGDFCFSRRSALRPNNSLERSRER
jgi:hypothetical protein